MAKVDTPAPELYRQDLPSLSSLEAPLENGPVVLQLVILEILDFIGQEWTKNQITDCSVLAYQEYHWFNTGELKQFSQRVKVGYFGKIYGKFAPAHLMEYLRDYSDEMWEARADYYGKKRIEESPVYTPLTQEEQEQQEKYFASLKELAERLSLPDPIEAEKADRERQERVKRHIDFFKSTLTPEQQEEMEQHRKDIQEAAKKYESGEL